MLHRDGDEAGASAAGMERIAIVQTSLADLPPIPAEVPVVSFMREVWTDAGLRIDVLRAEGSPERGYATRLEPDGQRLLFACNPAVSFADIWLHFTRYLVRRLLVARGALLLHGNLMQADGRCVALLGPSGAGKSSLSVALLRAGARPLADDVVRPVSRDGGWAAWPGFTEILIEEEAMGALGVDPAACAPFWKEAGTQLQKFAIVADHGDGAAPTGPVPLAGIFVLQPRGGVETPRLRHMKGVAAFASLAPHAGLNEPGPHRAARTRGLLDLAGAVPVWLVDRPNDVGALGATASAILTAARPGASSLGVRPEEARSPAPATGGGSRGA
jgi:hypothetical protein